MCSPCGPMICYKYEDCGPPKGKSSEGTSRAEESGAGKKDEKENQLKRIKSRELRGGVMYYSCHCIKRNGLQHDCRRTGCGGEPACLVLPDPLCPPSQLARARGLADPGALAAHMNAQGGGGQGGSSDSGTGSGKRFIVCELKGISPEISSDKGGKCCKCSNKPLSVPTQGSVGGPLACICSAGIQAPKPQPANVNKGAGCSCNCNSDQCGSPGILVFDEKMIEKILASFDKKDVKGKNDDMVLGPGGRLRKASKVVNKEEPCTRPGCVHWQPPPPCVWDAPCKADCFETPPGIQPGRNPLTGKLGVSTHGGSSQSGGRMKLLNPVYCTGSS